MDDIMKDQLKQMLNETEEMIGGCKSDPLFVSTLRTIRDNLISAINQTRYYDREETKSKS